MLSVEKITSQNCNLIYDSLLRDIEHNSFHSKAIKKTFLLNIVIPLSIIINDKFKKNTLCVSVSGGQGSGKTTITRYIKYYLKNYFNLNVVSFSIDDLYLSKDKRIRLSEEIHPLLLTRGVPGTHNINLAIEIISTLIKGGKEIMIPRFSKKNDDLLPKSEWTKYNGKPDIIILEGWCMGASPQEEGFWQGPINSLEKTYDTDGFWAKWVNDQLSKSYEDLFKVFEFSIYIKSINFEQILNNRWLQEKNAMEAEEEEREKAMYLTKEEVYNFVMHFERITKQMEKYMPAKSDIIITRKSKTEFLIEKPEIF